MKIVCNYSGKSFCDIYVESNGVIFPAPQWDDFAEDIIFDWVQDFSNHVKSGTDDFQLTFMDGPYFLQCKRVNGQIRVQGICDRKTIKIEFVDVCSYTQLHHELYQILRTMVEWPDREPSDYRKQILADFARLGEKL